MVCDKCDPLKIHRVDGIEKIVIAGVAIALKPNQTVSWQLLSCKFCGQSFSVPTYNPN